MIASHRESRSVLLLFFYSDFAYELSVGDIFSSFSGVILFGNEFYGVRKILILPLTPFVRRPNSITDDVLHFFLYFGSRISCL